MFLDDTVTQMIQPIQQGKALYDTNKDVINGALSAMAVATGVGPTIEDWIGEGNYYDVNPTLDGLRSKPWSSRSDQQRVL